MGSDGMEKYKYADTAKINVKPDGSVVCSLYVNDSKEKKEYFKNAARMKKAAGSNGNSKKKRTVAVSKSTKAKHRDKLRVESYLQANNWEYVLRVPITSVDYSTTWKNFKDKYGYRHKERPLQYVMVKGDGELYGAISNAPVDGDKIPLVNVEHSIVSAFDKSLIKQITALSLRYEYKGKEHSYVSSNGLNEKSFEFVNLAGIEYFSLPNNALVTQMQASLVFNGGTVEENLAAARRFIEEKKVENVAEENKWKKHVLDELKSKLPHCNRFKIVAPSVAGGFDNLDISEPEEIMFEGKMRTLIDAKYKGQIVYREIGGESMMDRRPAMYFIFHRTTGKIYYVGLAKEPLNRYCDHFGKNIHRYKGQDSNTSDFYRYIKANGLSFDDFSIGFIPCGTGFAFPDSGLWAKTGLISSYNEDAPEDIALWSAKKYKGDHTDKLAEGDEAFLQCVYYEAYKRNEIDLFIAENGLPLYWRNEAKKREVEKLAKDSWWTVCAPLKKGERPFYYDVQPLLEEIKWRFNIKENHNDVVWDLERMLYEVHCENVEHGYYAPKSPVFREIVKKQADFLGLKNIDLDTFIADVDAWTFNE